MMRVFLLAALAAVFFCAPARADIIQIDVDGVVTSGSLIRTGMPDIDLTGAPFDFTYIYDTAKPAGSSSPTSTNIVSPFYMSLPYAGIPLTPETMDCVGNPSCQSSYQFTPTSAQAQLYTGYHATSISLIFDGLTGGSFNFYTVYNGYEGTFSVSSIAETILATPIASSLLMMSSAIAMLSGLTVLRRRN